MAENEQRPDGNVGGISRRRFLGTAAAATAGIIAMPGCGATTGVAPAIITRPGSSRFGGVQIGTISYSFRSMPGGAEQILSYLVDSGLSSVELMGDPILAYAGAPTSDAPSRGQIARMTDPAEREAAERARAAHDEEMRRWRASPPMEKFQSLRSMYGNEGVTIHLAKFSPGGDPDAAEFAFRAARALGATSVTNEIGEDAARVMGAAAARHGMKAAFHNHGQPSDPNFAGFDHFLALSPANSLNLDFGHYYGFTGKSPVPEIRRLHDRITSMHMKDKATPTVAGESGANMPWGQGNTPIAEVLRLVQREGYPINCDIELEYPIPEGSNAVAEVRKCAEFCREILT